MSMLQGTTRLRGVQLDNNFGLKDSFVISEAETVLTVLASAEGVPQGGHNLEHLKAIHKHLLGDMYPWAGELRMGDHWVGNDIIKSPSPGPVVEGDMNRVLADLNKEPFSQMNQIEFPDKLASYYTRIYQISPFPDGNARATRMFIDSVATTHDMMVDWAKLPHGVLNNAAAEAVAGNSNKLKSLMRHIVGPTDLFELYSTQGLKSRSDDIIHSVGLSGELLPSESLASTEQIIKLARHAKIEVMKSLEEYATTGKSAFRDWDSTSIQHQHHAEQNQSSGASKLKDMVTQLDGYAVPDAPSSRRSNLPGIG